MLTKLSVESAEKVCEILDSFECTEESKDIRKRIKSYGVGDYIEFSFNNASIKVVQAINRLATDISDRSLKIQMNALEGILSNPLEARVSNLNQFLAAFESYMLTDTINGWLFEKHEDGQFYPWLVISAKMHSPGRNEDPVVQIEIASNSAQNFNNGFDASSVKMKSFHINKDEVKQKTVAEVLLANDFIKETPSLISSYNEDLDRFKEFRKTFGRQYRGEGIAIFKKSSWGGEAIDVSGVRMINNDEEIRRVITDSVSTKFWTEDEDRLMTLPVHCTLYMFHLGLHKSLFVHVRNMKPYEYNPGLREKIVLPENHQDLIDVLTDDIDVVLEDIVEGKSGGTTILCKGEPGLGKTLTAEVYSEVIGKPLYRVHSGQLGIDPAEVEQNLGAILRRASRWNAVLLLDEADVFIRRRDDDIHHNAVVASFLRSLEYFNGLLFMTTNRSKDIDDAIASRCVAIIEYEYPDAEGARRIWRVLSDQFEGGLSDELIGELVTTFKKTSGRDIKELLKLTIKFARKKGIPLDVEAFKRCAIFKGVS